jgi:hypothetical protein
MATPSAGAAHSLIHRATSGGTAAMAAARVKRVLWQGKCVRVVWC